MNGAAKTPAFARIAGYVEQFDSHNEQSSVYEAVLFSAQLRLAGVYSDVEMKRKVDNVIVVLGLTHLQHARIGSASTGGVSPEGMCGGWVGVCV